MKKFITVFFACLILTACERPASITNWSPINDVATTLAVATDVEDTVEPVQTQTPKETAVPTEITPLPEVDLSQFPNPLPKSMKGYELMSWQIGLDWNFTLVTGTNREKSFEELMQPDSQVTDDGFVKITVPGVDQIEKVLAMLPSGSEVYWGGMDLAGQVPDGTVYFTYPSQEVMDEIAGFCQQNNIKLVNLSEPQ